MLQKIRNLNFFETACVVGHDELQGAFNMGVMLTFNYVFDSVVLKNAFTEIVKTHQSLQLRLAFEDKQYCFVQDLDIENIPFIVSEIHSRDDAREYFAQDQDSCFDSAKYLIRFHILRNKTTSETSLLFSMHHCLGDAVVLWGFFVEILNMYLLIREGKQIKTSPLIPLGPGLDAVLGSAISEEVKAEITSNYNTTIPIAKKASIAERNTAIREIIFNEEDFANIKRTAKSLEVSIHALLNAVIYNTIKPLLPDNSSVVINSPFNAFIQKKYAGENQDNGYGVGIIMQTIYPANANQIYNTAKNLAKDLKEKIAHYQIPKIDVDNYVSAMSLIKSMLEASNQERLPIMVMNSNIGKSNLPAIFRKCLNGVLISGGRKAGDQLILLLVTTVGSQMYITLSYTNPLVSQQFVNNFMDNFINTVRSLKSGEPTCSPVEYRK